MLPREGPPKRARGRVPGAATQRTEPSQRWRRALRCAALAAAIRAQKSHKCLFRRRTSKTTYAGSQRARKPQRRRQHGCGTAARPNLARARPKPTTRRDAGANRTRNITTPRPTRARAPSPLRRANMEAPLSPSKGKKASKAKSPGKKDPKSPAKVKSVKKAAAETPVKTSSKKKAAETPQTKPKEKRSGPYEARWKKAMCVARRPYFLRSLSRRRRRGATPSPRRRHAHTTQEHLPEVPARVRTRRHRFIWYIDGRHDAHDD